MERQKSTLVRTKKLKIKGRFIPGGSVPSVKRRVRLPGLVVGGRRGAHLAAHARGRYERGLRADSGGVHGRHLMVSAADADAATAAASVVMMVVGQSGPAGWTLHGHQFGR